MPVTNSDFDFSLSPNPLTIVLGRTGTIQMSFSNTSTEDRGYNLSAVITLPNGLSYISSTVVPTSVEEGPAGTIILSWTNIKDLAPNETDYTIGLTLKGDEIFRESGLPVPFDIPISSITMHARVDTLPRGDDDPGNVKIPEPPVIKSYNYIPLRYNLTKTAPGKMPKGAGFVHGDNAQRWPYSYTLNVVNNTREESRVTLIDNLPNGVKYIGNLSVSPPGFLPLMNPNVKIPEPPQPCTNNVVIDWGSFTLPANSSYTVKFDAAIWDNYTEYCVENSGNRIPHMTPLTNVAVLNGLSGPVEAHSTTNAMDATIDKSVNMDITDTGNINMYRLVYRINQYDDITSFVVTDTLGNGQTYITGSASIPPDNPSPPRNMDGTTTIVWSLPSSSTSAGSTAIITFNALVDIDYINLGPVSADDAIRNNVNVDGINETPEPNTQTPDSSSSRSFILTPFITKELVDYYYNDGSPKTINSAAPGDFVEFKLSYNASNISAKQRNVEIDEYAPLNMDLSVVPSPIVYGGNIGGSFAPFTVSPNGIRWQLGSEVPGGALWTAKFKVPVKNIEFTGFRNNLGKLSADNTSGFAYSERDQVPVSFGVPNISFGKTVSGPDINGIKAGEIYSYTITISNVQNNEGTVTDAFNMTFTDTIPEGLKYNGIYSVTGTGAFTPPVFSGPDGRNVSMAITKLAPGETLIFIFQVLVSNTVISGRAYTNDALLTRPFSQQSGYYKYSGDDFKAAATLKTRGINLLKLISPSVAKIGDKVTYILQATVPQGTIAYNVRLTDTYPGLPLQQYITGSSTKDGIPVPDDVSGNQVSFPVTPFVDASISPVTIICTFDVRVTNVSNYQAPYSENQTDRVRVVWEDSLGTLSGPVNAQANLSVRTPFIRGLKEQRNFSTGQSFRTQNVNYLVGQQIEYRLSLTNDGAERAFNTVVTDVLNNLVAFNSITFISPGSTAFHDGFLQGGTLTWIIPTIAPGETVTLSFLVTTLAGVSSGGSIQNRASIVYNSNNNGFGISFGPFNTNTVNIVSPSVTTRKELQGSINGFLGEDIIYKVSYTVPNGTIAYNVQVEDTLPDTLIPPRQTYIGPAVRQELPGPPVTVVPQITGQTVRFPADIVIDASSGARTIIYIFTVRITNAIHEPPYQEIQTDTARVRWALTSGGAQNRSASSNLSITARTPNIVIVKKQSKIPGDFGFADLIVLPGDTIYYELTILSNGAQNSIAFNIELSDVLNDFIIYGGLYFGPDHGTVIPPGPSPGATLKWNIEELPEGDTARLVYYGTVGPGIGSGAVIPDRAEAKYFSNSINGVDYTSLSNTVKSNIPLIGIAKTAPETSQIGEEINYRIELTFPSGVAAYNIVVTDIIPPGQQYVPGSWAPFVSGQPVVNGNTLIYSEPVSPHIGPASLIYTFRTLVTGGKLSKPFVESQYNSVQAVWNITEGGTPANLVSAFAKVNIISPEIVIEKEQKNETLHGEFTKDALMDVNVDDIIYYKLKIKNIGPGTAYNVTTTDKLDNILTYQELISIVPPGGSIIPPWSPPDYPIPDGTVTWVQSIISPGEEKEIVFSVKVGAGYSPGDEVTNRSSTLYATSFGGSASAGPILSNPVTFNHVLPVIEKTADKRTAFIGDTVNYTIRLTIKKGGILYDARVQDVLPAGQSYTGPAWRQKLPDPPQAVVPSVIGQVVSFEPEGTIDAGLNEIVIVYTFSAIIDFINLSPQDEQIDQASVLWKDHPEDVDYKMESDNTSVYVTDSSIKFLKEQRNYTANNPLDYTTNNVPASTSDIVHYRFSVQNTGASTVYNVSIYDFLDGLLEYSGPVGIPPAGTVINYTGGIVNWLIASISPGINISIEIAVKVLPGGMAGGLIPDSIYAYFSAVEEESIFYTGGSSGPIYLQLPDIALVKSASKNIVSVGEIITYTIGVTVPYGLKAYDVIVKDTLPVKQLYTGMASIDGSQVFPDYSQNIIAFQPIIIDALEGIKTVEYRFDARILEGNDNPILPPLPPFPPISDPPYTEEQIDRASANWKLSPGGEEKGPVNSDAVITVIRPYVWVTKEQRNVTKNTGLEINPILADPGDILEFRIVAHNFGSSNGYNIIIKDALGQYNRYNGVFFATAGTVSYEAAENTLTWIIEGPFLPRTIAELTFQVVILGGLPAGGSNSNSAVYTYASNDSTPIFYGPVTTNVVVHKYPNVSVGKLSDTQFASVNSIIKYTLNYTLPEGTLAFNLKFSDILPVGQIYNGNAKLNGKNIVPAVDGQLISFPVISFAEAFESPVVFSYTFDALAVSAIVDPETLTETQYNEACAGWNLVPQEPVYNVCTLKEVIITDNSISIQKQQRNASTGTEFTVYPILVSVGDIVEYRLQAVNTGPNTIYDVTITDILGSNLSYAGTLTSSITHSGEARGGTVTWHPGNLESGEVSEGIFKVRIALKTVSTPDNTASGKFKIQNTGPFYFGNVISNTVLINYSQSPGRGLSIYEIVKLGSIVEKDK